MKGGWEFEFQKGGGGGGGRLGGRLVLGVFGFLGFWILWSVMGFGSGFCRLTLMISLRERMRTSKVFFGVF